MANAPEGSDLPLEPPVGAGTPAEPAEANELKPDPKDGAGQHCRPAVTLCSTTPSEPEALGNEETVVADELRDDSDGDSSDDEVPRYFSSGEEEETESEGEDESQSEECGKVLQGEEVGRTRSLSLCSEDGSFIEFEAPCSTATTAKTTKCTAETKDEEFRPEASSFDSLGCSDSDTGSEQDDDDEDWDTVDGTTAFADGDEELAIFRDAGLKCCLLEDGRFVVNGGGVCSDERKEGCREFPGPISDNPEASSLKVKNANDTWEKHYSGIDPFCEKNGACVCSGLPYDGRGGKNKRSRVSIAGPKTVQIIYEDPEVSEYLRESRRSDFPQRQADRERMERILRPIFDEAHREKMWRKIHGGGCQEE